VLVATVSNLPGVQYTVVGWVSSRQTGVGTQEPMTPAIQDLEKQAQKLGADAVIGVQVSASVYRTLGFDVRLVVLLGTAIKFT
jgi:hypothetical protein